MIRRSYKLQSVIKVTAHCILSLKGRELFEVELETRNNTY